MAKTRYLFFDTSALVKYVHDEAGSDRVIDLIEDENHDVCISELARVEFASGLHRKRREGALSDSQLQQALSGFDEVLSSLRVEPIGPRDVEDAVQRIRAHGKENSPSHARPLHLATFLLVSGPNGDLSLRMIASTTLRWRRESQRFIPSGVRDRRRCPQAPVVGGGLFREMDLAVCGPSGRGLDYGRSRDRRRVRHAHRHTKHSTWDLAPPRADAERRKGDGVRPVPHTVMRAGPFEPMSDLRSAKKATLELVERLEKDVTFEDSTDPGRDP